MEILSVNILGERSMCGAVKAGEYACLTVSFESHVGSEDVNFSVYIWDEVGQLAFAYRSGVTGRNWQVVPGGIYTANFRMKMNLGMGLYVVDTAIHRGGDYQEHCDHYLANATQVEVEGSDQGWFGGHTWLESELAVAQVGPIEYAAAKIEVLAKPARMHAGSTVKFQTRVTNQGSTPWPSTGPMLVCCCYHIVDVHGEPVVWDGERSVLSCDVGPGESVEIPVAVKLPETPASYVLRLTLVQEGAAWFDEQGASPVEIPIEVRAATPHRGAAKA